MQRLLPRLKPLQDVLLRLRGVANEEARGGAGREDLRQQVDGAIEDSVGVVILPLRQEGVRDKNLGVADLARASREPFQAAGRPFLRQR